MGGVSTVLGDQLVQCLVDRSVAAIVTDLKDAAAAISDLEQLFRVVDADRERLFAKDVLPCRDSGRGDLGVRLVRGADEHRIAIIQKLLTRRANLAADA